MAWEDKTLKKNAQNEIVPQAFNDVIDDYEPVKSTDGALHNVLYGPNGLPLKAINDKLEVRSTELEALVQGLASEGKLEQTRALVDTLSTKVDELNTKVDALTEDGSLKVQQSGTIKQLAFVQGVTVTAGTAVTVIPIQNFGKQALRYRVFVRPLGMASYEIMEFVAWEGATTAVGITTIFEGTKSSNAWSEVQTPITGTFGIRVANKTDTDYSSDLVLIGYRG